MKALGWLLLLVGAAAALGVLLGVLLGLGLIWLISNLY